MLQEIIVASVLAAAAVYLAVRSWKSLHNPGCGCEHESQCPYARKYPASGGCPLEDIDSKTKGKE